MDTLRQWDDRLLLAVDDLARRTPWLHGPVLGYATYGVVLFAALLLAGVVLHRADDDRRLARAGWACVATVGAVALNQPLVSGFAEARPYTTHPGLLVLATRSTDPSFPSDHAVMAGAAAAALWLVSRRLGALATVAALLMAASRVYIAAHYPWDVVAGLVFGAWVSLVGWVLLARLLTVLTGRLRRLPVLRQVFPEPAAPGQGAPGQGATVR